MPEEKTCKDCIYYTICEAGHLCNTNCKDHVVKANVPSKPDVNGFVEYSVETAFPYIFTKCDTFEQVETAKRKLKEIGRSAIGVVGCTESGNDFFIE